MCLRRRFIECKIEWDELPRSQWKNSWIWRRILLYIQLFRKIHEESRLYNQLLPSLSQPSRLIIPIHQVRSSVVFSICSLSLYESYQYLDLSTSGRYSTPIDFLSRFLSASRKASTRVPVRYSSFSGLNKRTLPIE